jgi:hypothetical protein
VSKIRVWRLQVPRLRVPIRIRLDHDADRMLGRQSVKVKTMLRDAAEDLLAFTGFPAACPWGCPGGCGETSPGRWNASAGYR